MTNNLWIAHTGGDCPVDTETEVEVMFSGDPTPLKNKAMCFHRKWWAWDELSDESIIAYRIVEQPKADWEKWFDNYRDSRIDGPAVTFEELYQVIAARLKAEGRG